MFKLTTTQRFSLFTLLIVLILVSGYVSIFVAPFAQNITYHNFADTHSYFGVSNFLNVMSNVLFVGLGMLALYKTLQENSLRLLNGFQYAYVLFFIALIGVGLGSSYYHINPDNSTLLWDRLPMGFAFMMMFSIVIAEHISLTLAKKVSLPLVFLGVFSVLYWYIGEQQGVGDLRLYFLVQYLPMLIIPMILILFKSEFSTTYGYWTLLFFYFIAKLCESFDTEIYTILGWVSGHTLKHVFAACALYFLLSSFQTRKIRSGL